MISVDGNIPLYLCIRKINIISKHFGAVPSSRLSSCIVDEVLYEHMLIYTGHAGYEDVEDPVSVLNIDLKGELQQYTMPLFVLQGMQDCVGVTDS